MCPAFKRLIGDPESTRVDSHNLDAVGAPDLSDHLALRLQPNCALYYGIIWVVEVR
jgi:hypothetical protein